MGAPQCAALLLAVILSGCAVPHRTSARFFQGKMNMVTRTPSGTVISVLNYCGQTACREPQVAVEWNAQQELHSLQITYPTGP